MRWVIVFLLILSVISCVVGYVTPSARIDQLEKELCHSMRGACEEPASIFGLVGGGSESDVLLDPSQKGESVGFFSAKSAYASFALEDLPEALSASISVKVPLEGEIDYRSFAFLGRLPPLDEPLSVDEVAYVFARIVSAATANIPIEGRLREITFVKEDSRLYVFARISLGLERLSKEYGIKGVPDCAVFSVSMFFFMINSGVSVDSERTTVLCETFELPEALLIFACNLAFGKKNYRELFEKAVMNVLVNARIYG